MISQLNCGVRATNHEKSPSLAAGLPCLLLLALAVFPLSESSYMTPGAVYGRDKLTTLYFPEDSDGVYNLTCAGISGLTIQRGERMGNAAVSRPWAVTIDNRLGLFWGASVHCTYGRKTFTMRVLSGESCADDQSYYHNGMCFTTGEGGRQALVPVTVLQPLVSGGAKVIMLGGREVTMGTDIPDVGLMSICSGYLKNLEMLVSVNSTMDRSTDVSRCTPIRITNTDIPMSLVGDTDGECSIMVTEADTKTALIEVTVQGSVPVSWSYAGEAGSLLCKKKCKVPIVAAAQTAHGTIRCGTKEIPFYAFSHHRTQCYGSNLLSVAMCSGSYVFGLGVATVVWAIGGFAFLTILSIAVSICASLRRGQLTGVYYCSTCDTSSITKGERRLHGKNTCGNHVCPYCAHAVTGTLVEKPDRLKEHVAECADRDEHGNRSTSKSEKCWWFFNTWRFKASFSIWAVVLLVLVLVTILVPGAAGSSFQAMHLAMSQKSEFDCAYQSPGTPVCLDSEMDPFKQAQQTTFRDAEAGKSLIRDMHSGMTMLGSDDSEKLGFLLSHDFQTTAGRSHIETPTVDLNWVTVESDLDHSGINKIKGIAQSIMPIETGSSVLYNIKAEGSMDSTLHVKLVEAIETYEWQFKYMSSHYELVNNSTFSCWDGCSNSQSCAETKSSRNPSVTNTWEAQTNWGCNPGDCWTINEGCFCATTNLRPDHSKGIMLFFEATHSTTLVYVCVAFGDSLTNCGWTEETGVFQGKTWDVTVADFRDRRRELDRKTMIVLVSPMDLRHIQKAHAATSVCDKASCQPGAVGDYQFERLNGGLESEYYSFNGIQASRQCKFAKIPTAMWTGLPQKTGYERFMDDSLYPDFSGDCHLVNATLLWSSGAFGDVPALSAGLNRCPLGRATVTVKTEGMRVAAKHEAVLLTQVSLQNCSGCIDCATGFECILTVYMKQPAAATVKVKSNTWWVEFTRSSLVLAQGRNNLIVSGRSQALGSVINFQIDPPGVSGSTTGNFSLPNATIGIYSGYGTLVTDPSQCTDCKTGIVGRAGSLFGDIGKFFAGHTWVAVIVTIACLFLIIPIIYLVYTKCWGMARKQKLGRSSSGKVYKNA